MKTKLIELIDFEKIDTLLEGFNKTTGFVTAILDLEGKVLSKSGWRQICTEFHRINPETEKKCTISDTELAGKLAAGEKYHFYQCLNGLVDVAVPLVVNGEHIANLFSGQLFFEEPDRIFFKKQAIKYGFDEKKYLEALAKVPVISQEKVQVAMDFLLNMTKLISEMVFQKQEQTERNKTLKESEEKYRMFINDASEAIFQGDANGDLILVNHAASELTAYSKEELLKMNFKDLFLKEELKQHPLRYDLLQHGEIIKTERRIKRKDGTIIFIEMSSKKLLEGNYQAFVININERKQAEDALKKSERNYRFINDKIRDVVWLMDLQGKSLFVSPSIKDFTGYTVEEYLTQSIEERFTIESAAIGKEILKKELFLYAKAELPKDYSKTVVLDYLCKDGSVKTGELLITPYFDESNKLVGIHGVTRDITLRKQAEKMLIESEDRFKKLSSFTFEGIIIHNNAIAIDVNQSTIEMLGYDRNEIIGKNLFTIIHPDSHALVKKNILKEHATPYHIILIRKDGSIFDAEIEARNISFNGEHFRVACIRDITERMHTENILRKSEERYALVIDASEQGIWDWNVETNEVYYSELWKKQIGFKEHELKNDFNTWVEHLHPDEKENCQNAVADYLKHPVEHFFLEFRFRHKDGTYRWIHNKASSLKNNEGKVIRMFGFHTDITERKQFEEKLRQSEEKNKAIVLNTPDHIFMQDKDLKYFFVVNPQLGLTEQDMLGKTDYDIFTKEDADKLMFVKKHVLETGEPFHYETSLFSILGKEEFFDGNFIPTFDECAKVNGLIGYFRNVTEHKQAEAALKESNSKINLLVNNLRGAAFRCKKIKIGQWNILAKVF